MPEVLLVGDAGGGDVGRVEARILSMAARFAALAELAVDVAAVRIGALGVAGRPLMRSRASRLEDVANAGAFAVEPAKRHLASDSAMSVI